MALFAAARLRNNRRGLCCSWAHLGSAIWASPSSARCLVRKRWHHMEAVICDCSSGVTSSPRQPLPGEEARRLFNIRLISVAARAPELARRDAASSRSYFQLSSSKPCRHRSRQRGTGIDPATIVCCYDFHHPGLVLLILPECLRVSAGCDLPSELGDHHSLVVDTRCRFRPIRRSRDTR